jgi:S-DNA-T family DNA segregation ATPase FtsK/SpoIIIE
VRCDDPTLEPFHVQLHLPGAPEPTGAPGSTAGPDPVGWRWCQLAGRRPVLAGDGRLRIGRSTLAIVALDRADAPRRPGAGGTICTVGTAGPVVRSARTVVDPDDVDDVTLAAHADPALGPLPSTAAIGDLLRLVGTDGDTAAGRGSIAAGSAGVAPALVSLAIGTVLALALGQPLMAVMGAAGAVVALGTWGAARLRRHRDRRDHRRRVAHAAAAIAAATAARRAAVEARRRSAQPGLPGACRTIGAAGATDTIGATRKVGAAGAAGSVGAVGAAEPLWCRRPGHGDAFSVVLGTGPGTTCGLAEGLPAIDLLDVAVLADVGTGARLALTGALAGEVVRSVVVQLAATTGPADWQLVVVSDRPDRWQWLAPLPQLLRSADGAVVHDDAALAELAARAESDSPTTTPRAVADAGGGDPSPLLGGAVDGRHLVVVTDAVERLAVRTSALRRLLHLRPAAALVAHVAHGVVPAVCTTVWATTADATIRSVTGHPAPAPAPDTTTEHGAVASRHPAPDGSRHVLLQGLGARAAADLAAGLAAWTDPEAPVDHDRALPAEVALDALWAEHGTLPDRASIARRWRDLTHDAPPAAPIGVAADGTVELDLVRDGPHGLVAGTTGSGKSELLRTIVLSLALSVPPDQLAFVLVDFKGGATFDRLDALPHVVGVVTDLEPRLAERVLRSLRAEVTRREQLLRRLGSADLAAARARAGAPVLPRLAIVVDEFAALALEHPHLLHSLVDVARRGRSLGVHLLLATQRPNGIVSEEIRTNTDLRIALRLHDASEAVDVVGDPAPSSIRRSAAGRAVLRLGPGEVLTFQGARPSDVDRTVREIAAAAASGGRTPGPRPWCDPLPERLTPGTDVLGLVDVPDEQRIDQLDWTPGDGHVLVVGSRGSGVTTTLAGWALRRLAHDAELVVVDAHGDERWAGVAGHPGCAAVAALHGAELLHRAVERAAGAPPPGGRLVVVDGLAALRRELDGVARAPTLAVLDTLLQVPPPGVTLLIGDDSTVGLGPSVLSRCARRLVLHVHDPSDAHVLGVRAADVPDAVPGRAHDATLGRSAQLAGWPDVATGPARVERVRVLPDAVAAGDLPRSSDDGSCWRAVPGLDHATIAPALLEVPHGEHVLVLGPARSGRSTLLAGLRRCWSDARPDAAQVVLAPRRVGADAVATAVDDAAAQVVASRAAGRAVLLVVDDAELVPDAQGALAALAGGHDPLVTMVVACRPDSVRSSYGHWASALRRHRRGVLMAACDELDADLLGAQLPRHVVTAPRPGLCWLVGDGRATLAQAAG